MANQRDRLARQIVAAIASRRSGHICSSLSVLDTLIALLLDGRSDPRVAAANIVLSKGHAAPALYAVLEERGDLSSGALIAGLRRLGTGLEGHPRRSSVPGVEVSTGSLGNGLAYAVGFALGQRYRPVRRSTICVVSDGELQTGIAYEALVVVGRRRPPGFVVVVDHNGWQTDGRVEDVTRLSPEKLLECVGLSVVVVDGHDSQAVLDAVRAGLADSPTGVVARTTRCKGVEWASAGTELYGEALSEDLRDLLLDWAAS